MGREPGWGAKMTGRPPMRSPGRPPFARKEHRRLFWATISQGATSTDAGLPAGVSEVVGTRWFRECGGGKPALPDSECECSAVQQGTDAVVDQVAEAQGVAAQCFEAAVDSHIRG